MSNEIFRQIEMVENDHDSTTAAALEVRPIYTNYFNVLVIRYYLFIIGK